jgi:hypothetical protein
VIRIHYVQLLGGKLMAIGSGYMFSDKYIDQESNEKLRDNIFQYLIGQEKIQPFPYDHDDIDVRSNTILFPIN